MPSVAAVIYSVCACIGLLYGTVVISMLVWRRREYPVNGRAWILVVTASALTTVVGNYVLVRRLFDLDCAFALFAFLNPGFGLVNCVLARVVRLWYLFSSEEEKLYNSKHRAPILDGDFLEDDADTSKTVRKVTMPMHTWFMSRRHLGDSAFLVKAVAGATLTEVVMADSIFFLQHGTDFARDEESSCPQLFLSNVFLGVISMITIALVVYFGWKIRRCQDAYFIKREFRYLAYLAVPLMVAVVLSFGRILEPSNPTGVASGELALHNLQFDLTLVALWLFLSIGLQSLWGAYPLYKSFQGDMAAKGATRPRRGSGSFAAVKSTSLMEILLSDKYAVDRQDFECHLMHEFSLENILFFQAAHAYSKTSTETSDLACAISALTIYREYIRIDAPNQVNLSHAIIKDVEKRLRDYVANFDQLVEHLSSTEMLYVHALELSRSTSSIHPKLISRIPNDIFERPKSAIYNLMSTDSFPRWKMCRDNDLREKSRSTAAGAADDAVSISSGMTRHHSYGSGGSIHGIHTSTLTRHAAGVEVASSVSSENAAGKRSSDGTRGSGDTYGFGSAPRSGGVGSGNSAHSRSLPFDSQLMRSRSVSAIANLTFDRPKRKKNLFQHQSRSHSSVASMTSNASTPCILPRTLEEASATCSGSATLNASATEKRHTLTRSHTLPSLDVDRRSSVLVEAAGLVPATPSSVGDGVEACMV